MIKRSLSFLFISAVLTLTGCTVAELKTVPDAPDSQEAAEAGNAVPGEAILLLTEETADNFDEAPLTKALDAIGVREIERVFPDAGPFEARHRAAGLHRWYRVNYDPTVSATKAGNDLSALPGVEDVSFPPKKVLWSTFNDPYLSRQWNYINTAQRNGFVAGADINVKPVWERYTAGSSEVIVAVVDGGVDANHKDLRGVVLSPEEGSHNFIRRFQDFEVYAHEHGTHVGGTIAAINNNGEGVCGVAGGRDGKGGVRIMSCQIVAPGRDNLEGDEAQAIVWAADHGAVIANCSWGFSSGSEEADREAAENFQNYPSALRSAIDYFVDNAGLDENGKQVGPMAGGVIFFASGNEGHKSGIPGGYDRVLAVAAHGPQGKLSKFSNYGEWVDLVAPGGSDSNTKSYEWVLSTTPDDTYSFFPGTSMAAPHAAGVAALIVSYFGGPGFTNEMLTDAIVGGSDKDALDLQGREIGGGKLDALGAFEELLLENISFTADKPDWTVKSHVEDDMHILVRGNLRKRLSFSVSSDCPGLTASCSTSSIDLHVNALKAQPGSYTIRIKAGNEVDETFPLVILPNSVPAVSAPIEDKIVNAASTSAFVLDLDEHFSDADGEVLQYRASMTGDGNASCTINNRSQLTVTPSDYGLSTIHVEAYDARQAVGKAEFRVLARNQYRAIDIFPNPVTDWLHVRPGTDKTIDVKLYNTAGACVFESGSIQAGPFQPLDICMEEMAGGPYSLVVNGEKFSIVKK